MSNHPFAVLPSQLRRERIAALLALDRPGQRSGPEVKNLFKLSRPRPRDSQRIAALCVSIRLRDPDDADDD